MREQLHRVIPHLESSPPAMVNPPADHLSAAPAMSMTATSTLRLASPERFSGDTGDCRTFLVQCDLHFKNNPAHFASDKSQIAFILSHLTGRAAAWATAEWSRESAICQNLSLFRDTLSNIFDHTSPAREASRAILQIKQGHCQVVDYTIECRTLAADSG